MSLILKKLEGYYEPTREAHSIVGPRAHRISVAHRQPEPTS